jgi:ABC-2 type transport system ATP-binding protein
VADSLAIETADLRKSYGATEALRGLSLAVPRGSMCGFLGRNGSGKTTTLKVLLGMARPTSGTARVFDMAADHPESSVAIRRRTGFVSEGKDLYDHMTVDEIVRYTASFYPRWRDDLERQYLAAFELPRDPSIKTLSLGQRTRVALLLALCRGADLLLLDEPTSGLDPSAIEQVLQTLVGHAADTGATVFFSSHQIAEVEQIADRVAIVDRGRIVVDGAIDDLRQRYRRLHFVFDGAAPQPAFRADGVVGVRRHGRELAVLVNGNADAIAAEGRAMGAVAIDAHPLTLKDIFLERVDPGSNQPRA